ncbi:sterile alpha motif domain-containing protein 9-like isoform X2 [Sebastes umbrosus]|uniref:sterile alpha motif domain-containing protein 9-like isoform X2 n=1 Tax=Sebastes umbrosus TaxID=72105 RepID=UPI0018A020FD|nr:sterile alpha motif domain-containing protein 9-like isoform X2 [Sebastes umbrosus]
MANGPALSTAKRGEIDIGNKISDSFSQLDVLYANQFEGESFNQELLDQTEENFYRGAPPKWLNFHISEKAESEGTGTPFIKRDGYDTLVEQIRQKRKNPGISTVKLFHQPGCGGTTLAMKVLWDLRKTFRSAVLTGSTSDSTRVAEEVVHLFTAGSRGNQNTVLLLVNDEKILGNLEDHIRTTIAEQKIVTHMPVVILLNCVREDDVLKKDDHVVLQKVLSDTEKQTFSEKKRELDRMYSEKCKQFHGFNIMQTNFSQDYIQEACSVFKTVKRAKRTQKTQLAAFLSLLNAYVPGSYLLESQCLDFFKHDRDFSLEDRMEHFSHLIVTFQHDLESEKKVCMAHPMIARCCTELMAEAGLTRSDTARNFLTCLCSDEVPPFLLGFVKDMLTKRRPKRRPKRSPITSTEIEEDKEKYSRLILDIQENEGDEQSVLVLELASDLFTQNPFFPQALARFYYIEVKDYNLAEMWAEKAKLRDPQNSFVADTLGQVHKNHLKNLKRPSNPREILQLATKAVDAFKDEERLAENERGMDMKGDGNTKVSTVFNTRGLLGYLQVCNLVYDLLVKQNDIWRRVLTKSVSLGSVLESLGDNTLFRFNDLINSLRDEIERKCAFLNKYLTYSKPDMKKDDPKYFSKGISECYGNYVGNSPSDEFKQKGADLIQKLKQNLADTSAGVLSCLDRECTESDLKEITTWWEEIFLQKDSVTSLVNYIQEKMPLIHEDSPELHMLTLLLCWPTDSDDKCVLDLSKLILHMRCSYDHAYEMHFRSRYLRPLFFIGNGQDLNRIVHRKVLEEMFLEKTSNWSNKKIFKDPKVQARLLKVKGEVRNYRVYATIGGILIEVDANCQNSLWRQGQVSFYLGFTIRGPVAFDIQTKPAEKDKKVAVETSVTESSEPEQIKPEDTTRGQHFVDRHRRALIDGVSDTGTIMDKLKDVWLTSNENYEIVRSLNNTQYQMCGILKCLTPTGKDALYEILKGMRSTRSLIAELEKSD